MSSENDLQKKKIQWLKQFYNFPFGNIYILRYMLQVVFAVFSPQRGSGE